MEHIKKTVDKNVEYFMPSRLRKKYKVTNIQEEISVTCEQCGEYLEGAHKCYCPYCDADFFEYKGIDNRIVCINNGYKHAHLRCAKKAEVNLNLWYYEL